MADNFRGLTTGATLGRELPFSQEAEEAVLGGVLRDPSVLPKVIEILKLLSSTASTAFLHNNENVHHRQQRGPYHGN